MCTINSLATKELASDHCSRPSRVVYRERMTHGFVMAESAWYVRAAAGASNPVEFAQLVLRRINEHWEHCMSCRSATGEVRGPCRRCLIRSNYVLARWTRAVDGSLTRTGAIGSIHSPVVAAVGRILTR
jgi:hypothetical protein